MSPVQSNWAQAQEGLTRTQQLLADDPIWLIVIKVVGLFGLGVVAALIQLIPIVNLISPVYSGPGFIHFALRELRRLRAEQPGALLMPNW